MANVDTAAISMHATPQRDVMLRCAGTSTLRLLEQNHKTCIAITITETKTETSQACFVICPSPRDTVKQSQRPRIHRSHRAKTTKAQEQRSKTPAVHCHCVWCVPALRMPLVQKRRRAWSRRLASVATASAMGGRLLARRSRCRRLWAAADRATLPPALYTIGCGGGWPAQTDQKSSFRA